MTADQICTAIRTGQFTDLELREVYAAFRDARANLDRQIARKITVGSRVTFVDTRNGRKHEATVRQINRKTASLDCFDFPFGVRVSLSMLTLLAR